MIQIPSETAIVVPCYNEATRLPHQEFAACLTEHPELHFCFVDDGSSDGTMDVLGSLARAFPQQTTVLGLGRNRGKGEAVRAGVLNLCASRRFDYVGYWDADLAIPLYEVPRFIDLAARAGRVRFICGSRIRRIGALVERRWYRHYAGRFFATAASLLLHLPIYDTQCGAKLIEAGLARRIFDEPFLSRWLFDVELLARTIRLLRYEEAHQAIFEIPLVEWQDKGASKVSIVSFLRAPWELIRIWRHYRLREVLRDVPTARARPCRSGAETVAPARLLAPALPRARSYVAPLALAGRHAHGPTRARPADRPMPVALHPGA